MIFSLVVPTIHRTTELDRLLASLVAQKAEGWDRARDLEVLIVDQNPDDRLEKILAPFRGRLTLVHLKAPPLGQSHAKNMGLEKISGAYVGFPDDDCHYAEDTLDRVLRFFRETGDQKALFGRGMDLGSKTYLLDYPAGPRTFRRPKDPGAFLGLEIAQFYTVAMARTIGGFDVDLCSGGKWGSGEETDYAIRALRAGFPIEFRPGIVVYHPLLTPASMDTGKLRRYSIGYGALCRKQGLYNLLILKTLKQLAGVILFAVLGRHQRAKASWIVATARLKGFLDYGAEIRKVVA